MLSLLFRGEFCLHQLENGHTKNEQKCPSIRTLTAVHGAVLEDLLFLSKIVGERIHVKLNGSLLTKVHLDKAQQSDMGTRLKVSLVSLRSSPAGMLTLSFQSFSWGKKALRCPSCLPETNMVFHSSGIYKHSPSDLKHSSHHRVSDFVVTWRKACNLP